MSEDTDRRLAVLEAREKVKELRATYAWHAARGQREGIANLFLPDGVFEVNNGEERVRMTGPAEILAFLEKTMWPDMIFPIIHMHVIETDGETATGTCVMEARTKGIPAERYPNGFLGYYHDRAVKIADGSWRWAERRWFTYWPEFEDSGLPIRAKA